MNPNKKIWYFTEGHSETNFVTAMYRNSGLFNHVKLCKSPSEFIDIKNYACYIHNSRSVDKIPYDVIENNHFIIRAEAAVALIVCDVEKTLKCPIARRAKIIFVAQQDAQKRLESFDEKRMNFVFSMPTIEDIYCSEQQVTEKVLRSLKHASESETFDLSRLNNEKDAPLNRIEKLLKEHGLAYHERKFSEKFFHQLQYEKAMNKTVQRLLEITKSIFTEG